MSGYTASEALYVTRSYSSSNSKSYTCTKSGTFVISGTTYWAYYLIEGSAQYAPSSAMYPVNVVTSSTALYSRCVVTATAKSDATTSATSFYVKAITMSKEGYLGLTIGVPVSYTSSTKLGIYVTITQINFYAYVKGQLGIEYRNRFFSERAGAYLSEFNTPIQADVNNYPTLNYKGAFDETTTVPIPYAPVRSWTDSKTFYDYYNAGSVLTEASWQCDPRFQSKKTGNLSVETAKIYYIKRNSTSSTSTYSIYGPDDTGEDELKATIPSYAKRILVMLQGGGGGGGTGMSTTLLSSTYCITGGGGGGGAFLLLCVSLPDILSSTSDKLYFYAPPAVSAVTANKTAGTAGKSAYMRLNSSYYWTAGGGGGGGAGTAALSPGAAGSAGSVSAASYNGVYIIKSSAGAAGGIGGGWNATSSVQTGEAGAGSGFSNSTINLLSSSSLSSGSVNYDNYGIGYSGGAVTTISTYGTIPGGGGSMLGAGGTGTSSSVMTPGTGAGGRGGYLSSTYKPGAGGAGACYIWWPQLPVSTWEQVRTPTVSIERDGSGYYDFILAITDPSTDESDEEVSVRVYAANSDVFFSDINIYDMYAFNIRRGDTVTWEYAFPDGHEMEEGDYIIVQFTNGYSVSTSSVYCEPETTTTA